MKKILLMMLGAICILQAHSRDFTYTYEDQTLTYTVISEEDKTCMTKEGQYAENGNYQAGNEVIGWLTIPSIAKDGETEYSVISIGDYSFYNCAGMTGALAEVSIPNSVTTIGKFAFAECYGMGNVYIGRSVTAIGESAFKNCNLLFYASIPDSVINIGEYAFSGCYQMVGVTIGNSVKTIGNRAFEDCSFLQEVTIPNSVNTIGDYAFIWCSAMISVTIPNSVTSIGDGAFRGCNSLKSVYYSAKNPTSGTSDIFSDDSYSYATLFVPQEAVDICKSTNPWKHFKTIEAHDFGTGNEDISPRDFTYTFEGQTLTYTVISEEDKTCMTKEGGYFTPGNDVSGELIIPSVAKYGDIEYSVTTIGDYSFSDCASLTSVTIGNSVKTIGKCAFWLCEGLASLTIGNSVETISEAAFHSCRSLASVTIPNSVTSIDDRAFYDCGSLTSVTIGNSVISIGDDAFYDCAFTSVIIPPSVTSVGEYAFHSSELLKLAYPNTLPDTFKGDFFFLSIPYDPAKAIIEDGFIYGPDKTAIYFAPASLEGEYVIPNTVTSIGDYAFYFCYDLTSIVIPGSVTAIGTMAIGACPSLLSIDVNAENPAYATSDHILFNKDKTELIQFPNGRSGSYEIPTFVTSIGDVAFAFCSGLTSVTIPESVISIGDAAFLLCQGLTSMDIPDSVISIGDGAFEICQSIKSVTIGNSVEIIGDLAFFMCSDLTSVTIGNSVKTIGDHAFWYCNSLTSVTIPESVETIGESAFEDCVLTSVYYCAKDPISGTYDIFSDGTYSYATLFVPQEAIDKCKAIDPWRNFSTIEAYDFGAGIECVYTEFNNAEPYEVYNLSGVKVSDSTDNLDPGMYIIRQRNIVRKISVR